MILYIGMTVGIVLAAYFVNNRITVQPNMVSRQQVSNRIMIGAIFTLLFVVSATRFQVGNDYGEYVKIFGYIYSDKHVSTEIGFNIVVRAVQAVYGAGDLSNRILFALFSFGTVFFFLKAIYDQSEWFLYSVFLLMTGGYYFSSMTSVRYYFVLAIALYAMKYALQKKWIPFFLWICFAALFHKSVLLVIPVYWLATRKWKKWHILLAVLLCGTCLVFQDFYRRIIFLFYPFYENSVFDNGETSFANIAKCVAVLVLCLLFYRYSIQDHAENRFYCLLNLGALILYVFCPFIPEISRVGYYLNVVNIFLIPAVLIKIPNKRQRIFFTVCTTVAFSAYLLFFLVKSTDISIRLLPYQSWLFG
ncbi:MAG TPA: EpsG family protein [Lachnospiraceae bacterium]|nr:EpsG family protein [Lachnospiraceae bacterium]